MEASREKVQKTRPRLVMTPAVSMDDIDEPATRRILCGETYCSAASRAMRETAALRPARANVKAPLPGLPAPANPITLPKLQPPFVSPEWRMETASWDARQLRAHCDHTKSFWLGQAPM
ncbi:jg4681, partial [Pararge aegeria aegeria]